MCLNSYTERTIVDNLKKKMTAEEASVAVQK